MPTYNRKLHVLKKTASILNPSEKKEKINGLNEIESEEVNKEEFTYSNLISLLSGSNQFFLTISMHGISHTSLLDTGADSSIINV